MIGIHDFCEGTFNLSIINIRLAGQFMTHLYISIMMALIVGAPYLIWELWRFIKPALSTKEKSNSSGAVLASSLLFYLGVLFSYFLIVPLTINFLGTYSISSEVVNQINLSSYISTILSVTMGLGVVFELPIMVFFLAKSGIISASFLRKKQKNHACNNINSCRYYHPSRCRKSAIGRVSTSSLVRNKYPYC